MNRINRIFISTFLFILTAYCGTACKNIRQDNKNDKVITVYNKLLPFDGKQVIISGVYIKHNPVPKIKRDNIEFLSGILMEGDTIPKLFLELPRPEHEQDNFNGMKVVVAGTYYSSMPQASEDQAYMAKYRGGWIYQISEIKLLND
jgi:hypothetical protein